MQTIDQASSLRQRIAEQMARQSDPAVWGDDDKAHEWDSERIRARLAAGSAAVREAEGKALNAAAGR